MTWAALAPATLAAVCLGSALLMVALVSQCTRRAAAGLAAWARVLDALPVWYREYRDAALEEAAGRKA